VEKPLCDDEAAGRALLADVKKHGVKLLVGHRKRFNHYVMATEAALDDGSLGDVTAVIRSLD
jgi:predicted dehydrogenase